MWTPFKAGFFKYVHVPLLSASAKTPFKIKFLNYDAVWTYMEIRRQPQEYVVIQVYN